MKIEDILQKHFNFTKEDLVRLDKAIVHIKYIGEKQALERSVYYKSRFGLTDEEFIGKLKQLPQLLSYSKELIEKKIEFF